MEFAGIIGGGGNKRRRFFKAHPGYGHVLFFRLDADKTSANLESSDACAAGSRERVKHHVAGVCAGAQAAVHQRDGLLSRVFTESFFSAARGC